MCQYRNDYLPRAFLAGCSVKSNHSRVKRGAVPSELPLANSENLWYDLPVAKKKAIDERRNRHAEEQKNAE